MDKKYIEAGKKYLHRRNVKINGQDRKTERWVKCEEVFIYGAMFKYEKLVYFLNDDEIKKQIVDMT